MDREALLVSFQQLLCHLHLRLQVLVTTTVLCSKRALQHCSISKTHNRTAKHDPLQTNYARKILRASPHAPTLQETWCDHRFGPGVRVQQCYKKGHVRATPAGRAPGWIPGQSHQRPWRRAQPSSHTLRDPWGSRRAPHARHGLNQSRGMPCPCTPAPLALPALEGPGTSAATHIQSEDSCAPCKSIACL